MGIFQRAHDIVQAKTNKALDAAEKPDEMLDLSYEKMLEQITQVRRALVDIAASKKRLELQEEQFQHTVDHLQDQAKQALSGQPGGPGQGGAVPQGGGPAADRRDGAAAPAADEEEQKLTQTLDALQKRVNDFRTQKETLKAQYTAAKADLHGRREHGRHLEVLQRLGRHAAAGTGQDRHHAGPLGRPRRAARVRRPRGRGRRHRRHPEGARPGRQGRAGRQRAGRAQGTAGHRRAAGARALGGSGSDGGAPSESHAGLVVRPGGVLATNRATTSASSAPRSSWRKCPAPAIVTCRLPGGAGYVRRCSTSAQPPRARVTVGERREERAVEARQRVERAAVQPGTLAPGRQAHQQGQLTRPGAEGLVGERRVVGRQDVVRHLRHGGPLHEEARPERRELLGEALVVEQRLLHGDGPVRAAWQAQASRPARSASAVCSAVLAATTRRTSPGRPPSRPSPIGPPQSWTTRVRSRRPSGVDELGHPVDVGRAPSARCGPPACRSGRSRRGRGRRRAGRARRDGPRPCGRGTTTSADRAAAGRSRRRPGPRRRSACAARRAAWRSAGRRGTPAGRRSAPRVSGPPPRRSVCRTAGTAAPGLMDSGRERGALRRGRGRRRPGRPVPGLRAGVPGRTVTVVDAGASGPGHRRRRRHPLARHQRRDRRRTVALPAPGGRALPGTAGAAGSRRRRHRPATGYGALRHALHRPARARGRWFAPFADMVLRRSPGEVAEITPEEAGSLFPPLGPVHRVLHAPGSARVDGRGMAAALRQAAAAPRRRRSSPGRCTAWSPAAGRRAPRRRRSASRAPQRGVRRARRRRRRLDGGGGGVARPRAARSARRRGRSCISASRRRRATGPSCSRCSPTISCPGPGGGWPAAAPSRPAPGSRSRVDRRRACTSCCASASPWRRGSTTRPTSRPASGCARPRPTTAPWWARLPGWGNAWVATGHGANGLLQGPYSARALAHAMAGVALPADEAPLPALVRPRPLRLSDPRRPAHHPPRPGRAR